MGYTLKEMKNKEYAGNSLPTRGEAKNFFFAGDDDTWRINELLDYMGKDADEFFNYISEKYIKDIKQYIKDGEV